MGHAKPIRRRSLIQSGDKSADAGNLGVQFHNRVAQDKKIFRVLRVHSSLRANLGRGRRGQALV